MRTRMVCLGGYSRTAVQAESKSMPDPEDITDECYNANMNNDRIDNLATFAGGCFWCMVAPFERQPGVKQVISGYTGGHEANPTYQEVLGGSTGHIEAVQITFDPVICPYTELLDLFWQQINPRIPEGNSMTEANHTTPRFSIMTKTRSASLKPQRKRLLKAASLISP